MNIGSLSQAGFYYQNNLAALNLLELFDFNTLLLHMPLENYEAGSHIDDIILTRKGTREFPGEVVSEYRQFLYTWTGLVNLGYETVTERVYEDTKTGAVFGYHSY